MLESNADMKQGVNTSASPLEVSALFPGSTLAVLGSYFLLLQYSLIDMPLCINFSGLVTKYASASRMCYHFTVQIATVF